MTSSAGLQANTRRFELYVRISMYVLLAFEPLLVIGAFVPSGNVIPIVLAVVQTVANIFVCRWALTTVRDGVRFGRRDRICLVAWTVLTLGMLVVVVTGLAVDETGLASALVAPVGSAVAAIAPALRARWVLIASLGAAALTGVVALAIGFVDGLTALGLGIGLSISMLFLGFTFWLSGWMLKVVWELDDARTRAADLAIAEERLRIARDLHDLYGRTLATVAVKSELAAELIRRGRPEAAADEIAAVRVIADQSGREMRQLVQGYREADLSAELAGARALLDSAGIRCVVHGAPPAGLPPETASALGWMLRESVTNVIRHSTATECFIGVAAGADLTLTVTNDKAGVADEVSRGSGLIGMGERLAAVGGRIRYWRSADRFSVEAVIPVRQPAASGSVR
ncbi:sensor histidine kinase [Microlunatus ginsengisoli]|uniref:Histidine kinase n=1 Tax=Microlunatus ginsengisoli TaxID=363863 RepID=A0ABP7AB62_9ACTN